MNGKGDRDRTANRDSFERNRKAIFGHSKPKLCRWCIDAKECDSEARIAGKGCNQWEER